MNAIQAFTNLEVWKMAVQVAESKLFGMKTPAEAFSLMLIAQAEGLHPALAARDYHIIQGRPAMKADAMLARFQQAGGVVEWLTYEASEVAGKFSHPAGGSVTIIWTMEMAGQIGLATKDNWKNYPRAMLRARCISEGIRTVYPGCVVGVYTPEELDEGDEAETVKPADFVQRDDSGNGQRDEPPGFEKAAPASGDEPAPEDVELTCGFTGKAGEKKTAIRKAVGEMSPRGLQFAHTLAERNVNDPGRSGYAEKDRAALLRIQLEVQKRKDNPPEQTGEVSEAQPAPESPADAKPEPSFSDVFGVLAAEAGQTLISAAVQLGIGRGDLAARLAQGTPFTDAELAKLEAIGFVTSQLKAATPAEGAQA